MIAETTRALVKTLRGIEANTLLSQGSIIELAELPALILTGPTIRETSKLNRDAERITAKDTENSVAVREVPPRWYDLRFGAAFSAKSNGDLLGLIEKCSRLPQKMPLLRAASGGRTREYPWRWSAFPSVISNLNASEAFEGRGEITVSDVEVYSDIRETVPLIEIIEFDTPDGEWTVGGSQG